MKIRDLRQVLLSGLLMACVGASLAQNEKKQLKSITVHEVYPPDSYRADTLRITVFTGLNRAGLIVKELRIQGTDTIELREFDEAGHLTREIKQEDGSPITRSWQYNAAGVLLRETTSSYYHGEYLDPRDSVYKDGQQGVHMLRESVLDKQGSVVKERVSRSFTAGADTISKEVPTEIKAREYVNYKPGNMSAQWVDKTVNRDSLPVFVYEDGFSDYWREGAKFRFNGDRKPTLIHYTLDGLFMYFELEWEGEKLLRKTKLESLDPRSISYIYEYRYEYY